MPCSNTGSDANNFSHFRGFNKHLARYFSPQQLASKQGWQDFMGAVPPHLTVCQHWVLPAHPYSAVPQPTATQAARVNPTVRGAP